MPELVLRVSTQSSKSYFGGDPYLLAVWPNTVIQEIEYLRYDIPAGAAAVGDHQWASHLDENVYKIAYASNTDRWTIKPTLPLAAFEFGRKICTVPEYCEKQPLH